MAKEIIKKNQTEPCYQECTSCEKGFDIENMKEDSDSNYFCDECYEVLAPIMKAEYEETLKI